MSQPLVSVVVPAFNHELFVEAALQSVADQDLETIELVVVDDQSRDRTAAIVESFIRRPEIQARFRRITFLRNEKNAGAHVSINRGMAAATGAYINILNSDDLFAPNRLSRLLNTCESGAAAFAFSKVAFIEDPSCPSEDVHFLHGVQDSIEWFPTIGYAMLRNQCALSTGNFFFSRQLYERVGEFSNLKYCHDWDFVLRAVLVTEPVFVPEALYLYRLHPGNSFRQLQSVAERETETVLRNYFFLCRTRPVDNPLAPSPAWGPFFSSFVDAFRYTSYLKP
jgi:glycosyltransferase involved in cell wall biosynthesis